MIAGEPDKVTIPELGRQRQSQDRLRGLRFIHTHLNSPGLSQEDLMDLVFLRLDCISILNIDHFARPETFQWAHLLPPNPQNHLYQISPVFDWDKVDIDFSAQIEALEKEFIHASSSFLPTSKSEKSLLISVGTEPKQIQLKSLSELSDLVNTAGLEVTDLLVQRVNKINPNHLLGKGKLAELEVMALQKGATILVFDCELTPAQMRNLSNITERKILDRTQIILDIFAQHATSKAGKLQVELAQLDYTFPRLVGKNRALSRLAGGIGGRGPGETKLELDRRKIRERRNKIKKELTKIRKQRGATRSRRNKAGLPIVALVGYTNAGKSTLLNTLTNSVVNTANKLFATLDPTSRRLRCATNKDLILTDTVGFIRYLPENLKEAFMATLEELDSAQILLQVADASHPEVEQQVQAVDAIIQEIGFDQIPKILALNKWDLLEEEQKIIIKNIFPSGIPISAIKRDTLGQLILEISNKLPAQTKKARIQSRPDLGVC